MLLHQCLDAVVVDHAGALGVHSDVDRARHADRVGDLHLAGAGQTGGDDVLGHVAGSIGGGTVHLGRVLAAEGTTAVRAGTAVGIDNDLAAGQAAVTLRTAHDKAAGRVDQVLGVLQQFGRNHRLDDFLDHRLDKGRLHRVAIAHVRAVLAGHHHGLHRGRLAIHVAHRHLGLGVRAQKGQLAALAQLGLALHQAVRVVDWGGHQLGRFVAGKAEHQALVAGADVQRVVKGGIHALGNILALLVVGHQHGTALVVNAELGIVVADALDGLACHVDVIHRGIGGDLAGQHHQTGVGQGFGGHAAERILRQAGIQDGIGDLVGHLVGVAFGDGFGGEEVIVRHACKVLVVARNALPKRTMANALAVEPVCQKGGSSGYSW